MDITWIGHGCFQLRDNEIMAITNPFPDSIGLELNDLKSSIITVSNVSDYHNNTEIISGNPVIFNSSGEYEYAGISVTGVMTPLGDEEDVENRNIAYNIKIGGLNICHLGDIKKPLTPNQIDELSPCDVLLTPVGGPNTLEVDDILQVIQDLEPGIVIPMQYNTPGSDINNVELEPFLSKLGQSEVTRQNRITLSKTNVENANMELNVLNPQGKILSN